MKSIAKALIIIVCLLISAYMLLNGHLEFSIAVFVFGLSITAFYDYPLK
jgi:hypothetical protein